MQTSLTYPLPISDIQVQTVRLTSPMLRVGGAVSTLNPFEYVDFGGAVYLPDADLLARALYQRGRLNDYLDRIKDRQEIGTLLKQVFGDDWTGIKSSDGRSIFPIRLPKWTEDRITEFRPMIRNGMGQLYIPGSSIKGAIRTAITYYLVKHHAQFNTPKAQQPSELELKIRERMQAGDLRNKYVQSSLDDRLLIDPLFTNYQLTYQKQLIPARQGPNTDFMRAVKISDSAPLIRNNVKLKSGKIRPDNTAIAGAVTVSSHFEDNKSKWRATIYAEMVRFANTTLTITLDRQLLSWFKHEQGMKIPFDSIKDILNICREFSQDIWDEERNYWNMVQNNPDRNHQLDFDDIRELYESETCRYKLRLGWGTGMTGTTIALALPDKLRREIRDTCGISAPDFDAPKSRRTVANNNGELKYLLGWTKLDPIE